MGYANLWQFLGCTTLLFLSTWFVSYTILRLAKTNTTLYLVVHPVVTFIFGNMIAFLFYVIGWVVSLNIVKKPAPIMWPLGLLTGWVIGLLLVARIYLIEEENKKHRVWIYLLAILCGFLTYVTEMRYVIHVIPEIRLFGKFLPVGLLYLGYLGIKLRIRYLQKKRINRWKEKGLEG